MWTELKTLWQYRELLGNLVRRELKSRYKNSFLGIFWSFLNPLITVLVMTFVFKTLMHNNVPNFSAYVLVAYLPYMFFQMAVLDATGSIIANRALIRKNYFPREILPLSSVISNYIHFLLAMVVFFLYLGAIYLRHPGPIFQQATIFLPVLLVINFMLVTGLGLLFSALNAFFEDVKYIVSIVMYLLFFLCPIMYFSESVPPTNRLYTLYHLNPVATLSTAYRKVCLAPCAYVNGQRVDSLPLDWRYVGIAALESFVLLVVGYAVFNRLKWKFVEKP